MKDDPSARRQRGFTIESIGAMPNDAPLAIAHRLGCMLSRAMAWRRFDPRAIDAAAAIRGLPAVSADCIEEASEDAGAPAQPSTRPGDGPRNTRVTVRTEDGVVDVRQEGPGEAGRTRPQRRRGQCNKGQKRGSRKNETPNDKVAGKIIEGAGDQGRPKEDESAADRREAERKVVQTMMADTEAGQRKAVEAPANPAPDVMLTPVNEKPLSLGTD